MDVFSDYFFPQHQLYSLRSYEYRSSLDAPRHHRKISFCSFLLKSRGGKVISSLTLLIKQKDQLDKLSEEFVENVVKLIEER